MMSYVHSLPMDSRIKPLNAMFSMLQTTYEIKAVEHDSFN
jgi:hypothetical protein